MSGEVDLGSFRGEEDIDKSKIIISGHAAKRFMEHFQEVWDLYVKNMKLDKRGLRRAEDLLYYRRRPSNFEEAKLWLAQILLSSDYRKAANSIAKTKAILNHQQQTFFFRNKRWQFRVVLSENLTEFELKTVVWLDDQKLAFCLQ